MPKDEWKQTNGRTSAWRARGAAAEEKQRKRDEKKAHKNYKKSRAAAAPLCPKCSSRMVRRANRITSESFWGCAKYPECRGTRNINDVQKSAPRKKKAKKKRWSAVIAEQEQHLDSIAKE